MRVVQRIPLRLALAFAIPAAGLTLGCEDTVMQPTGPNSAAVVLRTLTITGLGTGSGTVTAPAAGGQPELSCRIISGVAASTGCVVSYPSGTVVVLTATPDALNSFDSWGGGCTGSGGCQVTMNINRTVRAKFVPDKVLTVNGGGVGAGTVTSQAGLTPAVDCSITAGTPSGACQVGYPNGTSVTLTPTAASGSVFNGWSGGCTGMGTCTVSMTTSRTVKAAFKPAITYRLTVSGSGAGTGTVTSQAGLIPAINCTITSGQAAQTGCSADYLNGTGVTLTPVPAPNHTFSGWSGPCTLQGSTCALTMGANRNVTAAFNPVGSSATEATLGKWGPQFSTPIILMHVALLPTGKLLTYGHTGQPWLWDPSTYPNNPAGGFSEVPTTTELFCSGHTFLADGSLLVTGGHDEVKGNSFGVPDVNIFQGSGWQVAPPMAQGRWYPTATTLGNGEVVVTAGTDNFNVNVLIPEVWNGTSWRQLTGASRSLPYYPRMLLAPDGRLFTAGPGKSTMYLNAAGNGSWQVVASMGAPDRNYGAAVMLDGKVLAIGGSGAVGTCTLPVLTTAELFDLRSASQTWRQVGSMTYARRHLNATILPNGEVLVTGGTSACGFSNESGSVFPAEMWNPTTEQFRTLAPMAVRRLYHSTAILLPDARVLSGGGGDNPGSTNQFNAEMYTPPYLFNTDGTLAARPGYTLPSGNALGYGQNVVLNTSDAASIAKVTLIRLSATTHAFNQSQQLNTLPFTPAPEGGSLTATLPSSPNVAPPGPYMLFIVNQSGVPSQAEIVSLN
ncbi:MAG TPA: galactose oxidase-like domain-containing protein [Micromonosporaceae bacterium]